MDETAEEGNHANGTPWLNSCLIGNVTKDTPTDPKQDFHLFVNKDWILDTELPDGYYSWSNYSAVAKDTMEKAIKMLDGNDLPGHDAKLVQGMFDLYMDDDARIRPDMIRLRKRRKNSCSRKPGRY